MQMKKIVYPMRKSPQSLNENQELNFRNSDLVPLDHSPERKIKVQGIFPYVVDWQISN
jgi:hypothetical protein